MGKGFQSLPVFPLQNYTGMGMSDIPDKASSSVVVGWTVFQLEQLIPECADFLFSAAVAGCRQDIKF